MSRRASLVLTDGELRLMRVLWDRGRSTVAEVVGGLHERPRPAHNTVLTMLRILERKGHVRHQMAGRSFVFVPLVDRGRARRRALTHLVNRFFDGAAGELVLNVLEQESLPADVLVRLKKRIEGKG